MTVEFALPDLGEGIQEGEVVRWLVVEGDHVDEDQPVVEIETDKAVVDVPAPVDGTVQTLHADEGDVVAVGSVLVTFASDDDSTTSSAQDEDEQSRPVGEPEEVPEQSEADSQSTTQETVSTPESATGVTPVFAPPRIRRLARKHKVDLTAIEGSGHGGMVTEADVLREATRGESGSTPATDAPDTTATAVPPSETVVRESPPAEPSQMTDHDGAESRPAEQSQTSVRDREELPPSQVDRDMTLAMPAIRRRAAELGVDIDRIPASEKRGGTAYVTEADVESFASGATQSQQGDRVAESAGERPTERPPVNTGGEIARVGGHDRESEPYRGIRRTIGDQMERSKFTIPHATHDDEVDISNLAEVRDVLNADLADDDVKLTYLPFAMKAVTAALQEYPIVNSKLDKEAEEIRYEQQYNIGVAIETDAGLLVPVVHDVDRKGLVTVARELDRLVRRARNGELSRDEMQGGTFTITNLGRFGGTSGTPVINPPEVAILQLSAIKKRPWVVDDTIEPRLTLPLSLSFDHRVFDGATAAKFTNTVKEYLSSPERLLL